MSKTQNPTKYLAVSFVLVCIDQASKLLVHYYMEPGYAGQIPIIGSWLKLHYVLNPGMAFGMQLGLAYGKLFLTLFRLVAMFGIGWYMVRLARQNANSLLLWAIALILAGAAGNVIDSTFYGVFLNNAPYGSPTPWFHGQVIDMIFVDPWEGFLPDWVPVWGGQYYSTPIFNIADACIFIGVCIMLIFQGSFYHPPHEKEAVADEEVPTTTEDTQDTEPTELAPSEESTAESDKLNQPSGEPSNDQVEK